MTKLEILTNYYRSINRADCALCYNWHDLAALGLDDPREVFALNQQLIAGGVLKRSVPRRNYYGDSSLFLQ